MSKKQQTEGVSFDFQIVFEAEEASGKSTRFITSFIQTRLQRSFQKTWAVKVVLLVSLIELYPLCSPFLKF